MKILITSIIDLKKSQHNRPHEFLKFLTKNHDITILSINDWWKGGQDDLEAYSSEFNDIFNRVDYHYLTENRISPIIQELFFKKKIKKVLMESFDVHLNYNSLISGYEGTKRINTVFDIADDLVAMIRESPQIPGPLKPFGAYLGKHFLRKNIEEAKKVILTTEVLKKECDIPNDKTEIIPNGVDADLFRNYDGAKEELGLNGFIIGYVGVLREWVDLEPVFKALRELDKEIRMIVIGKEGRFYENIELAKKYGVEDRVIFMGMIPYSLVPKYISAMDICLIPFGLNAISQSAVPLKLFEYMACEKPVISLEIPGVKAIAGNSILYASNKKEYLEKVMTLYGDEDLRKSLGRKGRNIVQEDYNWEKSAEKLEKILLTVI